MLSAPEAKPLLEKGATLSIPGGNTQAYLMLPFRILIVSILFVILYPILLIIAILRALYIRAVIGKPSQALKHGTRNNANMADMHYPGQQFYKYPLDEAKLRPALLSLCAENDISEEFVELEFHSAEPYDWPLAGEEPGSYDIDYFLEEFRQKNSNYSYFDFLDDQSKATPGKKIRLHVWNGRPNHPTVLVFGGSGAGWDGSANFNFIKELNNRYMGNPPNTVFVKPEIDPKSAAKVDQASFIRFLLKMPFNIFRNIWGLLWNVVRAFKWAGGNGFGPKITAMNFSKQDSARLYAGAKALGSTPFAVFTYASVKAIKEVYGEAPKSIVQQASLQTRHFPVQNQGPTRDFVGDWLVGPIQWVPSKYELSDADAGYKALQQELQEIGPSTLNSFMGKAYGLFNCGAALFEALPTYNDDAYCFVRSLFMNNYGIRKMPAGAPFHTWNWNAPFWLGVNTINVDGRTTTLVGSMLFGVEVVKAIRDNMEATLRNIMTKAPAGSEKIPEYSGVKS